MTAAQRRLICEEVTHNVERRMRAELAAVLGRKHTSAEDNHLETWTTLLSCVTHALINQE